MSKRFLVLMLFAALVAVPVTIPAAASASQKASKSATRAHDWTRPLARIVRAAGQTKQTTRSTARFRVSFSESIRGFSAADVKLSGTAKAKKVKVAGLGNHKSFRVTVGVTRSGTIVVTVKARAVRDAAGNLSTAANRVTVLALANKARPTRKTPRPKAPTTTTPTTTTPTTTTPTTTTPTTTTPTTTTPTPPPASDGLIVGTVVNAAFGGTRALDPAVSIGARWVREDLSWPAVEYTRGQQDWSNYDNLFLAAAQKGIHILPIIDEVPTWSSSGTTTWAIPADPTAYARFVGQVTARYGPGGTFWQAHSSYAEYAPVYFEIWNEPWYTFFSNTVDPARYARLVKAATIAGRAANPGARFIIEAEWQYSTDGQSWHNWVNDMYTAVPDLNSYFDAYATHPYGNGSVDNWTPGNGDAFQTRRLEVIHDLFVSHGAGDRKMWITEIGWSTCATSKCYSEADQAANYARFDQLARTKWTYVAAVFYFAFSDHGPLDTQNKEYWFGVIRHDGSHKPSYDVLAATLRR